MDTIKKYNDFHSSSSVQKKIINPNNFTYKRIIKAIHPLLNKSSVVLDYGCGVGNIDLFLSQYCKEIVGTDVSDKAIRIAKESISDEESNVKFVTLDKFKKLEVRHSFDVVICSEVLEHIEDDQKLIDDLFRYCKKGAKLFLSTPSINAPLYKLGLLKKFDNKVGHIRRYSEPNLRRLFTKAGFKILKVVKTEGILRNSLYTLRPFGFFVRLIKGPFVDPVFWIDDILTFLFGESDIQIIAIKP